MPAPNNRIQIDTGKPEAYQNLQKYISSLIDGKDHNNYRQVMRDIQEHIYRIGLGQQCSTDGVPRGRLFLPNADARSCAPVGEHERKLGVSQNPHAWAHAVDIVDDPPTMWTWIDRGGPEYIPFTEVPKDSPKDEEPPSNPPSNPPNEDEEKSSELILLITISSKLIELNGRVEALHQSMVQLGVELGAATKQLGDKLSEIQEKGVPAKIRF